MILPVSNKFNLPEFGIRSYLCPCSAHAGYIGKDRNQLTGHYALVLQQIASILLHALSHRHDNT